MSPHTPHTPDTHVTHPALAPDQCDVCAWLAEPGKGRWCDLHKVIRKLHRVLPSLYGEVAHPPDCPDCQESPA